jgi:hypothetical protein
VGLVGLGLVSAKTEPTATVKKLVPADKIKSRLFIDIDAELIKLSREAQLFVGWVSGSVT